MDDGQKFLATWFMAAESLGVETSVERAAAVWRMVEHVGADVACQAVMGAASMAKFPRMPLPAEIFSFAAGECGGASEPDAMAAWSKVAAVLTNCTAVSNLCARDPRTAAGVQACGGWYTMVHGDEDERWLRKTFVAAYLGQGAERVRMITNGIDDYEPELPGSGISGLIEDGEGYE